jgi:hypothetical protein
LKLNDFKTKKLSLFNIVGDNEMMFYFEVNEYNFFGCFSGTVTVSGKNNNIENNLIYNNECWQSTNAKHSF